MDLILLTVTFMELETELWDRPESVLQMFGTKLYSYLSSFLSYMASKFRKTVILTFCVIFEGTFLLIIWQSEFDMIFFVSGKIWATIMHSKCFILSRFLREIFWLKDVDSFIIFENIEYSICYISSSRLHLMKPRYIWYREEMPCNWW